MAPRLIFGGGSIGGSAEVFVNSWTTPEQTAQLLQVLKESGITEIDAGASYPPGKPWHAETLLGEANAVANGFDIHTKIALHVDGPKLDHERIAASLNRSRSLIGVDKFALVYSHRPDTETPVAVTAAAFHEQHLAGKFDRVRRKEDGKVGSIARRGHWLTRGFAAWTVQLSRRATHRVLCHLRCQRLYQAERHPGHVQPPLSQARDDTVSTFAKAQCDVPCFQVRDTGC